MPHTSSKTIAKADRFGLNGVYRRILDSLVETAARRRVYHEKLAELQGFSDRDLADFGYHRSEIPGIARQAAGLA